MSTICNARAQIPRTRNVESSSVPCSPRQETPLARLRCARPSRGRSALDRSARGTFLALLFRRRGDLNEVHQAAGH